MQYACIQEWQTWTRTNKLAHLQFPIVIHNSAAVLHPSWSSNNDIGYITKESS